MTCDEEHFILIYILIYVSVLGTHYFDNICMLTLWFPASREKFMATEWEIEKF